MYKGIVDLRRGKVPISIVSFLLAASLTIGFLSGIQKKNSDDIPASAEPGNFTFVIDAGHGGEDCGAIGTSGVYEKDLNLDIALKLGEYLENSGFRVVYTRTDDKLLYTEEENIKGMRKIYDLKNRMSIANGEDNAILISLHMNSYGSSSAKGLQVYYSEKNKDSEILANTLQNEIKNSLQPDNHRTVKSGENIYLLKNAECIAVLIECGFISNPEECGKLSEKEYQKELSFAILCGIIKYIKN